MFKLRHVTASHLVSHLDVHWSLTLIFFTNPIPTTQSPPKHFLALCNQHPQDFIFGFSCKARRVRTSIYKQTRLSLRIPLVSRRTLLLSHV